MAVQFSVEKHDLDAVVTALAGESDFFKHPQVNKVGGTYNVVAYVQSEERLFEIFEKHHLLRLVGGE